MTWNNASKQMLERGRLGILTLYLGPVRLALVTRGHPNRGMGAAEISVRLQTTCQ